MEDVLPLSESTATGTRVHIQGIEFGFVSVLLHVVYFSSELLTGWLLWALDPQFLVKRYLLFWKMI